MSWDQSSPIVWPKTHKPGTPSVPKVKLEYINHVQHEFQRQSNDTQTEYNISPMGKARTLKPYASLVPYIYEDT